MLLTDRYDAAFLFASGLHRRQVRKGLGVPYLSHLISVSALVLEDGGTEDEAIAALLHDALEDQGDSYPGGRPTLRARVREDFGDHVLAIVDACTDDATIAKDDDAPDEQQLAGWRARKVAYLEHLREVPPSVLRVSCADKLHNARAILADHRELGAALWVRFRTRSQDDQLWYYRGLADAFTARVPDSRLAQELLRVVEAIEGRCQA